MNLSKTSFNEVLKTFKNILAYDAIDCLCTVFGATHTRVWLGGQDITISDLYDLPAIYNDYLASDFELEFYGGPPGSNTIRSGSLLALLIDNFLYAYINNQKSTTIKALTYVQL